MTQKQQCSTLQVGSLDVSTTIIKLLPQFRCFCIHFMCYHLEKLEVVFMNNCCSENPSSDLKGHSHGDLCRIFGQKSC